jgi:hypothetical protein
MNRILIYITLIVAAFFVAVTSSCSDEREAPAPAPPVTDIEDPFKDGELPINLPVTKAINDNNPENKIISARLIVIKNSIVSNNKTFKIENGHLLHLDSVYVLDTIPVGTVDMFIIVNEKTEWGLGSIAKKSIYFPEDIERKTLTFSAHPVVDDSNPIPMYRQYRGLHISNEGVFSHGGTVIAMKNLGEVDRLYAKVTLALKATFTDMANGGDPIKIDSVSIKSMPKQSYLTPAAGLLYPAAPGGYFNGQVFAPATLNESGNYTADAAGLSDSIIWYIPEHRLSDTTYLTYISIKASLKDNTLPGEQVEFKKIILGDGADNIPQDSLRIGSYNNAGIPLNNWFITRNTHYKVNATVKSFDKMDGSAVDVIMKVVGWTSVSIDGGIWQYELKVSQDEFHIDGTIAYEGVVTVETTYSEGWSATATTDVKFGDSSGNYTLTSLPLQTGTQLRFRSDGSLSAGSISVTAGPIVKKINLIRH